MLIALADPDIRMCSSIKNCLTRMQPGLEVVRVKTGLQALDLLLNNPVDVFLSGLVLPGLDGIELLEELNRRGKLPPTIVLTQITSSAILARVLSLNVQYYMVKPVETEAVCHRVMDLLADSDLTDRALVMGDLDTTDSVQLPKAPDTSCCSEATGERTGRLLMRLGLPASYCGYQYMTAAMSLIARTPQLLDNLSGALYPQVAQVFSKSPGAVERCIRYAIGQIWHRTPESERNLILGPHAARFNSHPSNRDFITLLTHIIE